MTTYRKVKRVPDGDTIELYSRINGSKFVRLAGINAPELHQLGGIAARNRLRRQVQGKIVTLQPVGRSYSRVVANVRHNGRLVR